METEEVTTEEVTPDEPTEEVPEASAPSIEDIAKEAGFDDVNEFVDKAKNLSKWETKLRHKSMEKPKDEPAPEPESPEEIQFKAEELKALEKAFEQLYGVKPDDFQRMKATTDSYSREAETRARQYADEFAESNPKLPFDEILEIAKNYNLPASSPEELRDSLSKAKRIYDADHLDDVVSAKVKEALEAETADGEEVVAVRPKSEKVPSSRPSSDDFYASTDPDEMYAAAKAYEEGK